MLMTLNKKEEDTEAGRDYDDMEVWIVIETESEEEEEVDTQHYYKCTLHAGTAGQGLSVHIIFTLGSIHFPAGCFWQSDNPSVNFDWLMPVFVCQLPAVTHSVIRAGVLLACGCKGQNDIARVQTW